MMNVYRNVSITMVGICEGCQHAELELISCYMDMATSRKLWSIRCKNEDACVAAIQKGYEMRAREGDKNAED